MSCRENQTHFLFNTLFPKIVPFGGNVKRYGRTRLVTEENVMWRTRFTCWITKAADKHSEYLILIAFPRQQSLRERASITLYRHCHSRY